MARPGKLRSCVGALFLSTLLATSAGAQSLPDWLQGNWSGKGHQEDVQSTWTMIVQVSDTLVTVRYPSLGCSAQWRLLQVTEKGQLEFVEQITADRNRSCAQDERVRVSPHNARQILIEYAHPWAPKQVIAVVLLNRQP